MTGKVIDSFRKNSHEEVRAFFVDFHELTVANVRVFETGEGFDFPTRKGIAIVASQLPQLKRLVDRLVDDYQGRSV